MFKKSRLKILIICLLFQAAESQAASFNINPINIQLSQHDKIETLTLTNQDEQPLTVHFQIKEWSQHNGQDVFKDSKDVMLLPNICVIKPQSSHIVRVVLKTSPHAELEKSYRLYVTEISTADSDSERQRGLQMMLQMSLPVFVTPLEDKKTKNPHLKIYVSEGKLKLHNAGTKHLHVNKIHAPHLTEKPQDIGKYILPNHYYSWEHPSASKMQPGTEIEAHLNNEVQTLNVLPAP